MFICPNCGNDNPLYFAVRKGNYYCRKCISFLSQEVIYELREDDEGELYLEYELTKEQKNISNKLIEQYKQGRNSLIHAVCGAGKTEIVYPLIEYVLNQGGRVGFAIPRKDVVVELYLRIKKAFKNNIVIPLFGGNTKKKEGDIIILTMHQIHRYHNYFDLLIADEIDAFPFKDNEILEKFFYRSAKGPIVMMSATPSKRVLARFKKEDCFKLLRRFHGQDIPVPIIVKKIGMQQELFILSKLKEYIRHNKPCLIFVPSREEAEKLSSFLGVFYKNGDFVHSERKNSKKIIEMFKNNHFHYLVTTSILERGITIKSLQVIIYHADNFIFDEATLEQISGRVGRKKDDPTGDIIFLCESETNSMHNAIKSIQKHNENM